MNTFIAILIYICLGCVLVQCVPNIDDEYIIKLKPGTTAKQFISKTVLKSKNGDLTPLNTLVKHVYSIVFDGFSAKLDKSQLSVLQTNNEVEIIEKNDIAKTHYIRSLNSDWITQTDSPWGLARVSANERLSNSPYNYTYRSSGGNGVTVYVIDTGVYTQHEEFGGRAVTGINYITYESDTDLNGHGTHVSGTVAGSKYGIAKKANIIAVKIFDKDGSGTWDDAIAGIEWVIQNATGKRSVINMSLGGAGYTLMDTAVRSAVNSGITTVVSAGNSAADACLQSPAREPLAMTVAASDINDIPATFSNYGTCVDLYAPGVNITSAWIGNQTSVNTISGTSMASPHVAGLAAYFIAEYNLDAVDEVVFAINNYAISDNLFNVPLLTKNLLSHNDINDSDNSTSPTITTISTTTIVTTTDNSSSLVIKFESILALISMLILLSLKI